jgi:hypothetical protein
MNLLHFPELLKSYPLSYEDGKNLKEIRRYEFLAEFLSLSCLALFNGQFAAAIWQREFNSYYEFRSQ